MTSFHLLLQLVDTCLAMHILLQEASQHSETNRCVLTTQMNFCMLEICITEVRPTALFQGKVTSFLLIPTFTLAKIPEYLLWNRFHARNSQTQTSCRNLFLQSPESSEHDLLFMETVEEGDYVQISLSVPGLFQRKTRKFTSCSTGITDFPVKISRMMVYS